MRRRGVLIRSLRDLLVLAILGLVFILSASATLYLVLRKPTVTVPNVVGQRLPRAEEMARQVGLELEVKNRVHHHTLAPDTVIEQWPKADMTAKKGQSLRVYVSLGPRDLGQTRPRR